MYEKIYNGSIAVNGTYIDDDLEEPKNEVPVLQSIPKLRVNSTSTKAY